MSSPMPWPGRTFGALAEQNQHLAHWERTVADVRIHGTTRQQVASALSKNSPPCCPCRPVCSRSLKKPSAPCIATAMWKWTKPITRCPPNISANRSGCAGMTARCASSMPAGNNSAYMPAWNPDVFQSPGHRWRPGHPPSQFGVLLGRAQNLGTDCAAWAQTLVQQRGVAGMRALMGLAALTAHHSYKPSIPRVPKPRPKAPGGCAMCASCSKRPAPPRK